jgi:large subunit ribosomal protein L35
MGKKQKLKTNKAIKKRFKITGTGKVRRFKAKRRHLLTDKSGNAKRALRGTEPVSPSDLKRLKHLLVNLT